MDTPGVHGWASLNVGAEAPTAKNLRVQPSGALVESAVPLEVLRIVPL